jgi:hypothetical protein
VQYYNYYIVLQKNLNLSLTPAPQRPRARAPHGWLAAAQVRSSTYSTCASLCCKLHTHVFSAAVQVLTFLCCELPVGREEQALVLGEG